MDDDEKAMYLRYAGELVILWATTNEESYPLDAVKDRAWIAPLGIPRTSYWATFRSRDELWGRIQMLGQILNVESFKGIGDDEIEVNLWS